MRLNAETMPNFVITVLKARSEKDFRKIDHELLVENWRKMMEQGSGVAYGKLDGEHPVGFLLGFHTNDLMTGWKKAYEFLWCVIPKSPPDWALGLLREFEDGAQEAGCKKTVIGCNAAFKPKELARLYKRLGYSSVSESFEKKISCADEANLIESQA